MAWKQLFSGTQHAAAYIRFRPSYPTQLYEHILKYVKEKISGPTSLAIDVGCGSGQNTRALTSYFQNVIGFDISAAQIDAATQAETLANVQYKVGNFDNMEVSDGSCELITSALAAHWFEPREAFFKEVDRVLKPSGVLAIYGYGMPKLFRDDVYQENLTNEMWRLRHEPRLADFVTERASMVESHYEDFVLPYTGWTRVDDMEIRQDWSLQEFIGYLSTWSFYQSYVEKYPDKPDPLDEVQERFQNLVGQNVPLSDYRCTVTFPIFLLIGRKPA